MAAGMQLVTPGLVLREVKIGEADRILTVLTPELGVISVSAKGSLRLKASSSAPAGFFVIRNSPFSRARTCIWPTMPR